MRQWITRRSPPSGRPPFSPQNPANSATTMLAHTHLTPTAPPSHASRGGGGVEFRRKLHFLSAELHLDPFPLLALHPALRSAPLPLLEDSLRLLTSHGLSSRDAARVFSAFPSLLTSPPEVPLRFLSADAPLPPPLLRTAVVRSPRLLAASVPDTLSPALRFLRRRVSLRREPLPLAAALLLAFSVERTLLPKLLFLRDATGLPDPAVCAVLRRAPAILSYGIETNLTPKLLFLSERMGRDPAAELAEFPHYFAFSLEGRIRPRHEALRGVEMSLKDMLTSNDDEFRERLLDATLSPTKARL
ncbi:transcription termination factor MTEF1, chloroplastic-like [Phragmites australis]|uniref:transcription termination factor MTEF1, chloroplastic-like n=1 Tax=Phragmites australis TaxID=29695 RepID=UPI002D786A14|nr:transcription termination factor MTEF1, chloroplastic-like [Phragmites australis]